MNKFIALLFITLFCVCNIPTAGQPGYLFMSNTLQPDDILGPNGGPSIWYSVGEPYAYNNKVYFDTIIWRLERPGSYIYDSLFFVREKHIATNPGDVPQQSGKVKYVDGQNTGELDYGLLKFRMPTYDSIDICLLGSWEYLTRKH